MLVMQGICDITPEYIKIPHIPLQKVRYLMCHNENIISLEYAKYLCLNISTDVKEWRVIKDFFHLLLSNI